MTEPIETMETLEFHQPAVMRLALELTQGGQPIGALTYAGVLHRTAQARVGDLSWKIVRTGTFRTRVTVSVAPTEEVVATYRPWLLKTGGVLRLGENEYRFGSGGFGWTVDRYAWYDNAGTQLVTYANKGLLKWSGEIKVTSQVWHSTTLQVLVPLGLFLSLNDSDASSAASGAAGGS